MSIMQAAISAAQVRLRPILMTSLTMIFGMLPMMFASGVGANGKYIYRSRNCGWNADWYGRPVIYCTCAVYCFPVLAGKADAGT